MNPLSPDAPVAVMDSGVGGLSVLAALREALPRESFYFIADQAHVPYGKRPLEEVGRLVGTLARYARGLPAKALVLACHTASAAALRTLRAEYPDWPIIGMEPAVKPAAEHTHTGVVGVIATAATFQSRLYEHVVERFADGVRVIALPCPGLVERIERGERYSPELVAWLRELLAPMLAEGIDRLVLGCTHFPLARQALAEAVGPGVELIDPSTAVARQTHRRLAAKHLLAPDDPPTSPATVFATTGDPRAFSRQASSILGETVHASALPFPE